MINDLAGVIKEQREAAEDANKQASLVHTMTKSTMSAATLRNQEQRQQAMKTYDEHMKFIDDCLLKVERNARDQMMLDEALDKLRREENYSILTTSDQMTSLLDRQKMLTSEKRAIEQRLEKRFEAGWASKQGGGSGGKELRLPSNWMQQNLGDEFLDSVILYLSNHLSKYYMVYVVLRRVADDYDPERGIHWIPETCDMSRRCQDELVLQSRSLWEVLMRHLTAAAKMRINNVRKII